MLFNRWGLLLTIIICAYLWSIGAGDAFERAFPGFAQHVLDGAVGLLSNVLGVIFVPWDALADKVEPKYQPIVTPWVRGFWGHAFLVVFLALLFNGLVWHRRVSTNERAVEEERRTQRPGRVPFVDDPKRALLVGKDSRNRTVRANIEQSNVFIAAGTGSGKTAIMRYLADSHDEAVLFGLFDVSLPTLARMRYWQEQARIGNPTGPDGRPIPVLVWRPNPHNVPGWVKLQLCGGPALEAISRIQHAIRESAGSTGDQRQKARDVGVEIFTRADERGEVRHLQMLIDGWRRAAADARRDREVRVACARWASKVEAVKSMLGSAEGPDGVDPLEICKRKGKLAMEVNNFAVAEAAAAFGPLILGLFIWLIDASPVHVTVGFDEGNQLGDYSDDLVKLYTACRGRGGRACLCCQRPLRFKEVAPNADVVIIGGFGPGAAREREWASEVSLLRPADFDKHERNAYGRLMRRFGNLSGLMNLECYVRHEGVTEGPVRIENPYPEMKRHLLPVDWPDQRAVISVPKNLTDPDPVSPLSISGVAATRKIDAVKALRQNLAYGKKQTQSSQGEEVTRADTDDSSKTIVREPSQGAPGKTPGKTPVITRAVPARSHQGPPTIPRVYVAGRVPKGCRAQLKRVWLRHVFPDGLDGCHESTYRLNTSGRPGCSFDGDDWTTYVLVRALGNAMEMDLTEEETLAYLAWYREQTTHHNMTVHHECENERCDRLEHLKEETRSKNTQLWYAARRVERLAKPA